MANEIIISNKRPFVFYSYLRIAIIVFAFVVIVIPQVLSFEMSFLISSLRGAAMILILVVLLIDFALTPSFLELIKSKSGLELRQYHPDIKSGYTFQESRVESRILNEDGALSYKVIRGIFPLFNRIEFQIMQLDKSRVKSKKINTVWITKKELGMLDQYLELSS